MEKTGKIGKTEVVATTPSLRAKIRLATRADAARLREIYAYYVEETTVSFELETPSVAEMERRIAEIDGVYPFLVCVVEGEDGENAEDKGNGKNLPVSAGDDGGKIVKTGKVGERIVGYALAHRAFERAAYGWTAETSVYVDRVWRRRGIGEALYAALTEILEAQGVRTLYAVIVAENEASVEFHRRADYREFATFKDSGWKFGRWLDVVWLERTLGVWRAAATEGGKGPNPAPSPVRPLAELAGERLAEICADATRRLDGRLAAPLLDKKK